MLSFMLQLRSIHCLCCLALPAGAIFVRVSGVQGNVALEAGM